MGQNPALLPPAPSCSVSSGNVSLWKQENFPLELDQELGTEFFKGAELWPLTLPKVWDSQPASGASCSSSHPSLPWISFLFSVLLPVKSQENHHSRHVEALDHESPEFPLPERCQNQPPQNWEWDLWEQDGLRWELLHLFLLLASGIICDFVTLAAPWRGASSLLSLWKTNSSMLLHPLFLGLFQRSLQCPRCRSSIGSFWCWE